MTAPVDGARPLWVFLAEPGVADLLVKELKYRKIFAQKTRALKLLLRNYDMLVVPESQVSGDIKTSRLALHVLTCPVFGRFKVSNAQLDVLAGAWRRASADGFVSSVVGNAFQRQDLMRWTTNRLRERGIKIGEGKPARPLWLMVVEASYYFCFPKYNYHDAPGRERPGERTGALPVGIAAAMAFAAVPSPDEVVWDPVVGSGTLLHETAAQIADGTFIGTDIDASAVRLTSSKLQNRKRVTIFQADAKSASLPRRDISLTIANLPFGKQHVAEEGNYALYTGILRNSLAHASPRWRGCFLTSDTAAFRRAVADTGGIVATPAARVKIRGIDASIWLVARSGS